MQRPQQLQYTAPTVDGDGAVQRRVEQVRPAARGQAGAGGAGGAGVAGAAGAGAAGAGAVVASGANGERGSHAAAADGEPDFSNVSRNALCPCGSGKKFKRCHGDPRHAAQNSEQSAN
ncbi:SEC-C metal-binding domain-containing protein [Jiangella alba]